MYTILCTLFVLDSAKDEYKLICNWLVLALLKDGHCSTSDFLLGPVHVYSVVVKVSDVHMFQPQTLNKVVPTKDIIICDIRFLLLPVFVYGLGSMCALNILISWLYSGY